MLLLIVYLVGVVVTIAFNLYMDIREYKCITVNDIIWAFAFGLFSWVGLIAGLAEFSDVIIYKKK